MSSEIEHGVKAHWVEGRGRVGGFLEFMAPGRSHVAKFRYFLDDFSKQGGDGCSFRSRFTNTGAEEE